MKTSLCSGIKLVLISAQLMSAGGCAGCREDLPDLEPKRYRPDPRRMLVIMRPHREGMPHFLRGKRCLIFENGRDASFLRIGGMPHF